MKIYILTQVKDDEYDKAEKWFESLNEQYSSILREYYDKNRQPGSMMSWDVIPISRLKKIWLDYAKIGVVRDVNGMQNITDKMLLNLARLNAANDLGGHGTISSEDLEDFSGYEIPDGGNVDFYFDFLNTQYGEPISDYGLPKLNDLGYKLSFAKTAEEQLLLVDRMLNVIHQRGDLAALFVEGGTSSLDFLFNN